MNPPTKIVKAFEIVPQRLRQGDTLTLRGAGWGACPVQIRVDGSTRPGLCIPQGFPVHDGVQPDAHGAFVVLVPTVSLAPGEHRVEATAAADRTRRSAHFTVVARDDAETDDPGRGESPFGREVELWRRRFSRAGNVPPGMLAARQRDLRRMRQQGKSVIPFDRPITPGCNWTPVGPGAGYDPSNPAQLVYSGKIHAIAIDPTLPSTVYIGASGGGVWKTTDSGATWAPMSDYQTSLAIGTLTIDPNQHLHILAGTGIDPIGLMDYYGNGLLLSPDGGGTWAEAGAATFDRASISRIVFNPNDATSQHLLLSSNLGIYESHDRGMSWTQILARVATDMVLIGQPGGSLRALVGVYFDGIYTSTLAAGSWSAWTKINDPSFTPNLGRIVFGQCGTVPATIYAALESNIGADSLGTIVRTMDGGGTWTSVGKPAVASSQTWHAFHVTVHPTDPNTVFYGEVRLWRTTTGGAPWTQVTGILHADQNAFAFDPVTPGTVWAGNDGGIWRSPDNGATWAHRNNGLATFKCIRGAQHPQWDAVFLISSQDTGAFRGDGQPVWPMMRFGDTGPLGIDPNQPLSYFAGGYHDSIARSDSAGAPGTFVDKTDGITGQSLFYAPFVTDASNAGVCYFASDRLWRSPNHGDTWIQTTNVLVNSSDPITGFPNALSAIAPHPADPNTVYVASSDGHVFQVQRTGATWTIADVTVTDLTTPPLPAGVSISSLAVDGTGHLWASVASVLYPADVGEFTNDHVFRYDKVAGAWASRSTGLAVANPVNAIVADPSSATTLYCGADQGVFRTSDGITWSLWDDGLPEAPVFDLLLHQNSRLLRAVTHGRSVWERPLDATICSSVDLYLRDDLVDTGRVQPSNSNVSDPFVAGVTEYWYQSDDIKVDGPAPNYQTTSPVTDFVTFEAVLQHTSPRRGVVNRFYARVQNRGPLPATNVKLRAFFADAHAGLPPLPSDFWTGGRPFDVDPTVIDWTPIGPSLLIASVAPGMPAIVEWDWPVPLAANNHSCLLLLATCDQEPLNGGGILVVDTLVPMKKQVTLKNMQVEDAVPGLPRPHSGAMGVRLYNGYREAARYDLVVDWSTLPNNSTIHIAFEASTGAILAATKEDLKVAGAEIVSNSKGLFPKAYPARCGPDVPIDRRHVLRLRRRAGNARSVLPVLLPGRRSVLLLLNPVLPVRTAPGAYRFDVQQRTGKFLVGGSTYMLRVDR
jgi:photosystem II stability/assembly factor-like uncharacterized protein